MQRNATPTSTPQAPRVFWALFFCLAVLGCGSNEPPSPALSDKAPLSQSALPKTTVPDDGLIDDDGRSLWASPTDGPPIELDGIAEGSELILHLRPALLLATPEGQRIWRSLSWLRFPRQDGEAMALSLPGRKMSGVDRLVITAAPGETYGIVDTTVVADPVPTDELPLLRREIEQLLATSDADHHATLIVSPGFLLGDGGPLIGGDGAPLRRLLQEYARDDWKAMALSFHVDEERLYWELRVIGSPDTPELTRAREFVKTVQAAPEELKTLVEDRPWSNYSETFLKQTPAMLEVTSRYTRRGTDGRQTVINGYLPAKAAHNVAQAAELLVAELSVPVPAKPSLQAKNQATLAERLRQPVTATFTREPMESALRILTNTLSARFEIVGRDLQLEGITRNQMLSLDVHDKPAEEALIELLRQANPDPLATGPADPRQKLVYVLREETLVITTRAAAERRGERLPAVFTD